MDAKSFLLKNLGSLESCHSSLSYCSICIILIKQRNSISTALKTKTTIITMSRMARRVLVYLTLLLASIDLFGSQQTIVVTASPDPEPKPTKTIDAYAKVPAHYHCHQRDYHTHHSFILVYRLLSSQQDLHQQHM
jgi:hypothetical protein